MLAEAHTKVSLSQDWERAGVRASLSDNHPPLPILGRGAGGEGEEGPGVRTSEIDLIAADALRLPFADNTFDCVSNGFLLRNVADLPAALRELYRVLRPGGRLACLELTRAPALIAPLFRPYFEHLVPLMGRL